MKAGSPGYLWSKFECFLMSGCWDMNFGKLGNKTLSQCDRNADAEDRGDCNSSPCTSYRRANKCSLGRNILSIYKYYIPERVIIRTFTLRKWFSKGELSYYHPLRNVLFILFYWNYYQARNITWVVLMRKMQIFRRNKKFHQNCSKDKVREAGLAAL